MQDTINIVEPTLMTEAGHCYSFVTSLCKVSKGTPLRLWVSRYAKLPFTENNVQIERYFHRRIRRLQCYLLYRKLLAAPGKLFISTAGRADLALVDWALRGTAPQGKVYLYFHWFNGNDKKLVYLRKIARKQPNLVILGPTPSAVKAFQDSGFGKARVVPYPISQHAQNSPMEQSDFARLLYAGAARQDKGFSHVVDLIEHMKERGLQIPFALQTSPDHYGKYDATTKADILRLKAITYPYLRLFPETLRPDEYANIFAGAICVQPYNASLFADRISGVTFDALSAGSPIVATAGTWIARMVQRFDAGTVIVSPAPEKMLSAIQGIIADYSRYNRNARTAGQVLQQENSAEFLFRILAD